MLIGHDAAVAGRQPPPLWQSEVGAGAGRDGEVLGAAGVCVKRGMYPKLNLI